MGNQIRSLKTAISSVQSYNVIPFLFCLDSLKHPLDPLSPDPVSVPAFGFINQLRLTQDFNEFQVSESLYCSFHALRYIYMYVII